MSTYMDRLLLVQPLIKYLEENYFGRFKSFNLALIVVHDTKEERDLFIENLSVQSDLKNFEYHKVGDLTDVIYCKELR
jgi:hypothetical protein